ncbi:MAG: HAD family phosphatase [Acidobacteriota bacterium]|nr:HAD family phosphatase [Acidobacteriota bacterium]
MIQAILFDFNGVVIDDEPLHMKAYQEVLRGEDITLTEQDYLDSLGMDDVAFVRAAFARAGKMLEVDTLNGLIEQEGTLHRELLGDELPLFPGVVTFIKAAARRFTLGVVSMARREQIDYVLERAGLAKSFSVIVSAEDVTACKPDPACYRRAFELLNQLPHHAGQFVLKPYEVLVIEDSPPGIKSARAVGLQTLGVTNTVAEAALRAAGAAIVTPNLSDWSPDAVELVFPRR